MSKQRGKIGGNMSARPAKDFTITFRVDICVEEDGPSFYAYCPVLKGIHVDGETKEEALDNAKVAVELYIQSLIKHNKPIPLEVVEAPQEEQSSTLCPAQQRHTEEVRIAI
ncbi:MAG TPA: type II toxin-antitoxin system HicB family antitoxin [Syntrophorhabdaceae bacterium]